MDELTELKVENLELRLALYNAQAQFLQHQLNQLGAQFTATRAQLASIAPERAQRLAPEE